MYLGGERPVVRTAKVYAIGGVSDSEYTQARDYLINPVEEREAAFKADKPATLTEDTSVQPADIAEVTDYDSLGLAMSADDIAVVREYFKGEGRNPTIAEIRALDTYWSDHCRHTTFNTIIQNADITDERVREAFEQFKAVNGDKDVTLMNIATAAMRHLRKSGELPMLYETESDENNACTIKVGDTLIFFKNETHNHPTEIEPFGGASTCLGGAIRDPLSGRAYVYQAMRVTGSGDPRTPLGDTLAGKLPQRKITRTAADGYSTYGNQIGLASGLIRELYHPGYVAKRMELGAVIASAKEADVCREKPVAGDVVIAMGGRTGRDGIGGATGSSKGHEKNTVTKSAAEVQKGDAPAERRIQRLFCKGEVTRLIKKCNDFGAGGISVAIGELADGIEINLDAFPTKYSGLDGTELAISESQERMAVVVSAKDADEFLQHCLAENIEAVAVAQITESPRLVMKWRGKTIVDIARSFLDSAGAKRYTKVRVGENTANTGKGGLFASPPSCYALNVCSQKGLAQRFDATIGAGTVFAPYGGKYELTESAVMAALMPALPTKASMLAYGFDPYLSESDPFTGAGNAVVSSVAKLVTAGVDLDTVHLSLQEYFPRVDDNPDRWGVVFSAMLGAFEAQHGLKIAAIGGKDSMSGSFGDLHVPPTLVSFACGVGDPATIVSNDFKAGGNPVYALSTAFPYSKLREKWQAYGELVKSGKVLSAAYCEHGNSIVNMCLGNMVGYTGLANEIGSIVFEGVAGLELSEDDGYALIGHTQEKAELNGVPLTQVREQHEKPLEGLFPVRVEQSGTAPTIADSRRVSNKSTPKIQTAKPVAVIPVFPGASGETDAHRALERAGGSGNQVIIRNLTPSLLQESVCALEKAIKSAQMLIIPSCSAEYANYPTAFLQNPRLENAVNELLARGGLILKIGQIGKADKTFATANNLINRHQARYVTVRVSGTLSPWLSDCNVGDTFLLPVSSSSGRFVADSQTLEQFRDKGQIALQYADSDGNASMDIAYNPFGSDWAVAGLTSDCGHILETLVHAERFNRYAAKNISGNKHLPLFESGVKYFM
jgi:phosphoribosylformylglycinamidine synthase